MDYIAGRCTNTTCCSVASARRDLLIRPGDAFVCSLCGTPLRPDVTHTRDWRGTATMAGWAMVWLIAVNAGAFCLGHFVLADGVSALDTAVTRPVTTQMAHQARFGSRKTDPQSRKNESISATGALLLDTLGMGEVVKASEAHS
jgi:hypothetical protein